MRIIKRFVKRMIYGFKCDSGSYLKYLKENGASIGEGTVLFEAKSNFIDETRPYLISIGKNVQITKNVIILTHDYSWSVIKGINGEIMGSAGEVVIEDNVFIGMNSIILKNTHIENNVVIGANSLVKGVLKANNVYAGNPAKLIMGIDEYYEKRRRAQTEEALTLFKEYYNRFEKILNECLFSKFLFLFADWEKDLIPEFEEKMQFLGNIKQSMDAFKYSSLQQYKNYNEFVDYCLSEIN